MFLIFKNTITAFLFLGYLIAPHPIHVALTTVEYNKPESRFDITFKIFYDDLESIIAENYNVVLNLGNDNENPDKEQWLQKYLSEHFLVTAGNKALTPLSVTDTRMSEKAIWIYCSIPLQELPEEITVTNSVMMDMYADQTDLVILKIDQLEEGFRFHRKHFTETIKLSEKL